MNLLNSSLGLTLFWVVNDMSSWSDPDRVKRFAKSYSRRYTNKIWESILRVTGDDGREIIADFGCGPGLWLLDATKKYNSKLAIGLDASAAMLEYAKQLLQAELDECGFELYEIDFNTSTPQIPHNSLDLAFSGYVLHEVDEPPDFIRKQFEVVKTSGLCVVFDYISGNKEAFITKMTTEQGWDQERAESKYSHMCRHSIEDIQSMLERVGFSSITFEKIEEIRGIVVGEK